MLKQIHAERETEKETESQSVRERKSERERVFVQTVQKKQREKVRVKREMIQTQLSQQNDSISMAFPSVTYGPFYCWQISAACFQTRC